MISERSEYALQKKPLISVIVPVYKVEEYLCQCIDSILSQDYDNLEVILVDDGSPDGCGRICDEYAKKDGRVKVIHQENRGVSEARNAALNIATGEFFGFVDSDDWILPQMYSRMMSSVLMDASDICICGKTVVFPNKSIKDPEVPDRIVLERDQALDLLFEDRITSHLWSKLFRRELFHGILFPGQRVYEDIYVMHELFKNAKRVTWIKEDLYCYRMVETSVTNTGSIANMTDYLSAMEVRALSSAGKTRRKMLAPQIASACCYTKRLLAKQNTNSKAIREADHKLRYFIGRYSKAEDLNWKGFLQTLVVRLPLSIVKLID